MTDDPDDDLTPGPLEHRHDHHHIEASADAPFIVRWLTTAALTIMVVFVVLGFYGVQRQQDGLRRDEHEISSLAKSNAQLLIRIQDVNCTTRQESRDTLRAALFGILDLFPPTGETQAVRTYIDTNYPSIVCTSSTTGANEDNTPPPTIPPPTITTRP